MPIADIGLWSFLVPEGWSFKDMGTGTSYLEAPDGATGMYVKTVALPEPRGTAREVSDHVQSIQRRSFEGLENTDWEVAAFRNEQEGPLHRSALDMLDRSATYRVLSLVVSDTTQAIQITLHDYLCEDYELVKDGFAEVEASIFKSAGAA